MAAAELASTYAALILADEGLEITADKINTLLSAAKVEIEPIWATLLAKALEGKDVKDMLCNVGAGGGAAAPVAAAAAAPGAEAAAPKAEEKKKEEEKEESDDDMGFGLFDCTFLLNLRDHMNPTNLRQFGLSRNYISL